MSTLITIETHTLVKLKVKCRFLRWMILSRPDSSVDILCVAVNTQFQQ